MVPEGDIFVMWISNHYNYRQRIHFFLRLMKLLVLFFKVNYLENCISLEIL